MKNDCASHIREIITGGDDCFINFFHFSPTTLEIDETRIIECEEPVTCLSTHVIRFDIVIIRFE